MLFGFHIRDTAHVRAMTCERCGPSNQKLIQRYRVLPVWLFVGIPFQLNYVWECPSCKQTSPCDDATRKRISPEFEKPFWHFTPWKLIKVVSATAVLLIAALMLFWTLQPSRQERLQPKLATLQTGQTLVLEWTQISKPVPISPSSHFQGSDQFGRAKVLAVDAENVTLLSPPWVFENGFRAIVHSKDSYTVHDGKDHNKHAYRNLRADQEIQISRSKLKELLDQDFLLAIE
jgi:hypothetical protein